MALPQTIRQRTPNRIRDHPGLRAVALATGLIPPRTMHSAAEAALLQRLAAGARYVVEIGVYEGSSALVLCEALDAGAELHLIDPFPRQSGAALVSGWRGSATATQLAVRRGSRRDGPAIRWHIERSQVVGRDWTGPTLDLVFIDGDHFGPACREDWDVWHPHVRRGGFIAFHDARLGQPEGGGGPGPTSVVDELFRGPEPAADWTIAHEVDTTFVVQRRG